MSLFKVISGIVLSTMVLTTTTGVGADSSSQVMQEGHDVSVTLDGRTTYYTSAKFIRKPAATALAFPIILG